MPSELTKKLLQMFAENAALKNQVRRLQSQVKFLKKNCDCPPPPPPPLLAEIMAKSSLNQAQIRPKSGQYQKK